MQTTIDYFGATKADPDPSHVYLTCNMINSDTTDVDPATGLAVNDPLARFTESRDSYIINDASKYDISIIRFSIIGGDTPLWMPVIRTGAAQNNVNLTAYDLALTYSQSWNTNLGVVTFTVTPAQTAVIFVPEYQNQAIAPTPITPVTRQDISTRYYWISTYQAVVDMFNTALNAAYQTLYTDFAAAWAAYPGLTDPFPFATVADMQAVVQAPQIRFDEASKYFTIVADSDGFGDRLNTFTPTPYAPGVAGAQTAPQFRLFFDMNTFGLFSHFKNIFWNMRTSPFASTPEGYVYEILFVNEVYQNIENWALSPYSTYVPAAKQKKYWLNKQDYLSVDFWSPISSYVFTTTLLPVKCEYNTPPLDLGRSNVGNAATSSRNDFSPVISDLVVNIEQGAHANNGFVLYAPAAEYRMISCTSAKSPIQQVDLQVWWQHRLTGQLMPVSMFNNAQFNIKIMFRRKDWNATKS